MKNGNGSIQTIRLKIRRQDGPNQKPYWQEFALPYRPNMNVISCLMEIQRNPVDSSGQPVSPPAWEAACLEQCAVPARWWLMAGAAIVRRAY